MQTKHILETSSSQNSESSFISKSSSSHESCQEGYLNAFIEISS